MKLIPYKKLLAMGKEAIEASLAVVRANSAKKKAIYEMAKIEEMVANDEKTIQELCSAKELDFNAIIKKIDDIELLELRKKRFEKIVAELFPEKED